MYNSCNTVSILFIKEKTDTTSICTPLLKPHLGHFRLKNTALFNTIFMIMYLSLVNGKSS